MDEEFLELYLQSPEEHVKMLLESQTKNVEEIAELRKGLGELERAYDKVCDLLWKVADREKATLAKLEDMAKDMPELIEMELREIIDEAKKNNTEFEGSSIDAIRVWGHEEYGFNTKEELTAFAFGVKEGMKRINEHSPR